MQSDILASSSGKRVITMVNLEHIATLKWTEVQAQKLIELRGQMPRRQLERITTQLGCKVAHQYIQQLEQPDYYADRLKSDTITVSIEVVMVLCKALGADISDFFDIATVAIKV
ncbi:hypothetical protein [Dendronalium sp. ChiSLP03b]|uniref:hypothetical protein n=1 Tax=Dendronalium sp. ChiSLP03b TaxID=3075381 RepID=UPI00391BF073